jgi:hypothetical protein
VAELEQRSKQVSYETAALTSQRQQLAALDAQRRAAMRRIEESLATAGSRLDDRAKEQKLRQIRMAEEAYQVWRVQKKRCACSGTRQGARPHQLQWRSVCCRRRKPAPNHTAAAGPDSASHACTLTRQASRRCAVSCRLSWRR